jgi:hypothetical protein
LSKKARDIHDVLGAVSGLGRVESKNILAEVRANLKRLDECEGPHEFELVLDTASEARKKHRCRKCGGTIDSTRRAWYDRGLEHGRREVGHVGEQTPPSDPVHHRNPWLGVRQPSSLGRDR